MSPKVRAASAEDAETIAHIQVRAWKVAYRGHMPSALLDRLDPSQRAEHWRQLLREPQLAVWLATRESLVLGFLSALPSRDRDASPSVGEVAALYVDPCAWRQGAGRALLESTLSTSAATGFSELTLWVLKTNAKARAFYEHMGFAPDGATQGEPREGFALRELRYRRTTRG